MTTTTPTIGRPLAVGYTLTTTAGAMLLEHGGTTAVILGLVLLAGLGLGLLALIAVELAPAGPGAVAGGTLAIVLLAAACSAFVPWALWPGLVVLAVHGLAAVSAAVAVARHRTAEEA